jgi:putative proteasome-type protease
MFNAARVVGDALREIHVRDAKSLKDHGHEFNGTFILGGQIRGEEPRLFHIYSAGNFIESSIDTPYFQIGESKYGKPIIDRVISRSSSLAQAAKCALVSMDSTIRSNLSVGSRPLDLAIMRRDEFKLATHISIDYRQRVLQDDPHALGLRAARSLQLDRRVPAVVPGPKATSAFLWSLRHVKAILYACIYGIFA